jgi:hypothetical protein
MGLQSEQVKAALNGPRAEVSSVCSGAGNLNILVIRNLFTLVAVCNVIPFDYFIVCHMVVWLKPLIADTYK